MGEGGNRIKATKTTARCVCLRLERERLLGGGEEKGAPPKTKFFGATQQSHEIGSVGGGHQTRAHVGQCKSS